jgi:cell division protein FtsN
MHARDPADLYKDRIEVSLDGRQIFYLFFGGAVIAGLVFVLGVMVGRRIEARGHVDPARTAAAADPLAALDRLEGPGEAGGLSFKGTLTGAQTPTEVERTIGELEKARGGRPAAAEPKPEKKPEAAEKKPEAVEKKPEVVEPKVEKKPEAAELKVEKKPEAERRPEKAEARAEKPRSEGRAEGREGRETREAREARESREGRDGKEPREAKKKKRDGDAEAGGTRYTLQLSSFQDRQEADAFLASLKAAGFQAYVTETDVGGKGTFYRVRFGSYRSAEAASDAKAELERVTKKNASVMRL